MKNRFKLHVWLALAFGLMLVWALGGIVFLDRNSVEAETPGTPPPSIKVLIRTGTESAALRQLLGPFEEETGIRVDLIEVGRDGYFTTVGTQLLAGSETFDLVFVPNTSIAELASAGAIAPLDPYIDNPALTDRPSFDLDDFLSVYRYQDAIYALPTDISTHFLFYRGDLIPEPPQTWDEVYALAEKFSKIRNTASPTKWGLAMPAVVPEERTKIFASLLWTFGGDFLSEGNSRSMLSEAKSIEAAQYIQRLVKNRLVPGDLVYWDFVRTRDALLSGEIAMAAPYWNAAYPMIRSDTESPYRDQIKAALLPGVKGPNGKIRRVPFQHAWTFAMNASSTRKEWAWKFLAYATGKKGGALYAQAGGVPARRSILADPAYRETRPDFQLILESMKYAKSEPAVTYYPSMVEIVEDALAKVFTVNNKPSDAFIQATNELNRLTAR
ncbi:sugar ABC transporter substrate-binding protein [Cohnella pontilimi]|uniref:Sugar ABC transporter substrate-binding protein n=1 Tax=Cohnella pontilimi TaxID=2564100 RepID=A0A4U0FBX1_9BACL|nr:sugar ABC transporter substrate-binding protein [Cohnella pontilimi]TJY40712.1 sugar ABC transporter substrate-binding protein [Cohnella pontilimi]